MTLTVSSAPKWASATSPLPSWGPQRPMQGTSFITGHLTLALLGAQNTAVATSGVWARQLQTKAARQMTRIMVIMAKYGELLGTVGNYPVQGTNV